MHPDLIPGYMRQVLLANDHRYRLHYSNPECPLCIATGRVAQPTESEGS